MVEMVCAKCHEWREHDDFFSRQCKACATEHLRWSVGTKLRDNSFSPPRMATVTRATSETERPRIGVVYDDGTKADPVHPGHFVLADKRLNVKTTKTYVVEKHFHSGSGCYGTTVLKPKDGGPGHFPSSILSKQVKDLPEGTEIELTVAMKVTKEVPEKEFCQNPFGDHKRCVKGSK